MVCFLNEAVNVLRIYMHAQCFKKVIELGFVGVNGFIYRLNTCESRIGFI